MVEVIMGFQDQSSGDKAEQTIVAPGPGALPITLHDLRLMASALADYLRSSRAEIAANIPADLMPALPAGAGDPWIDSSGAAHVGRWRLEVRRDKITLVWAALVDGASAIYRYIAHMEPASGKWRVLSISVQILG